MTQDADMKEAEGASLVVEGGSSGLEYHLHPLVLINISDHCMRAREPGAAAMPRVVGCLLGHHAGRSVDVSNSFEVVERAAADGAPDFDRDTFEQKRDQYAETFKHLEILGWYATGAGLQARDLALHKRFAEITEAPIFLLMDAAAAMAPGVQDLPVSLYESAVHLVEGRPETLFVRAAHVMAASEAERIGVNAAAEVVVGAAVGGNSALAQHYTGLHSALKMLEERLEVLRAYVARVQAGEAPKNHQVLRMTSGLVSKLRTSAAADAEGEMAGEFADAALVNVLCLMTRGVDESQQLVEAANSAYGRR